jgi:hypothetical protein
VQGRLFAVTDQASSVHVTGTYTWSHSRKVIENVGMHRTGELAGFINDEGLSMDVIYVHKKMYVKLTPILEAYYHLSCPPPHCGEYAIYPRSRAAGLIRSVGANSTLNVLLSMGASLSKPTHTTFHGQPALKTMAPGYDPGAYLIMAATPQAWPLEAVDPGHFKLTYSQWNSVPALAAPPKSKIASRFR